MSLTSMFMVYMGIGVARLIVKLTVRKLVLKKQFISTEKLSPKAQQLYRDNKVPLLGVVSIVSIFLGPIYMVLYPVYRVVMKIKELMGLTKDESDYKSPMTCHVKEGCDYEGESINDIITHEKEEHGYNVGR